MPKIVNLDATELANMPIGNCRTIEIRNWNPDGCYETYFIMRVPGGWMYTRHFEFHSDDATTYLALASSVFVPLIR